MKKINDLIWNNNWQGKVDNQALRERIIDLLESEKALKEAHKQLNNVRKLFKRAVVGDDYF